MRSRRLVFDGNAVAYWRFHARAKNAAGRTAVEWIYQFIDDTKPEEAIIVLDGKGNWRWEMMGDYKQHRPPRPEGVTEELTWLARNKRGIPVIQRAGFEADDVIAALVADTSNTNTFIVSNDKDLQQLVCDSVLIYTPSTDTTWDAAAVRERWHGVGPEQLRALLAVMGDKSDGLPGVPGLGEKRSAALVLASGWAGITSAIAAKDPELLAPVISRELRELVVQFGDRVKLNYELVGLRTDALREKAA